MGTLHRIRCALIAASTAALLSACSGFSPLGITPDGANNVGRQTSGTQTFDYTGAERKFTVPPGVTKIKVVALGGAGAGVKGVGCGGDVPDIDTGICFGRGGRLEAEIPVTPRRETLRKRRRQGRQ